MRSTIGAVVGRLGVVGAGRQRRDVVGRLRLEVEDDEAVGDEVVDRVEPLVADEVLTVVVQPEVLCRSFEPAQCRRRQHWRRLRLIDRLIGLRSTDPLVIFETFFPANLSASTKKLRTAALQLSSQCKVNNRRSSDIEDFS